MATFKSASLRSFYDTTKKHLQCLRSLGQDDNQMQVLTMMQSKLPRSVLVTLAEMKPEGEEWTVENFQRLLKRHINAQEAGDLQKKLFQKPNESSRSPIYIHTTNTKHSTGESLLTNTKNVDLEEIASFAMMNNIEVINAVDTQTSNPAKNDYRTDTLNE